MAYTKYSLTPANNNAAPPDGAPEGMLPSAVNDTMRDMMAQIRDCGDGIRGGTYTMTAPVITGGSITGSSINNSAIGASTASTGAFTTLSASSTVSGTGFTNYFASPPALGGTAAAAVSSTNLSYTGTLTGGTGVIAIGTNQIYKDASGNIGFGTSSPTYLGATYKTLEIKGISGSTGGYCLVTTGDGTITGQLGVDTTATFVGSRTNHPLILTTNNTQQMQIGTNGNFGIGAAPNTQKVLVYGAGSARIQIDGSDNGGIFLTKNGFADGCTIAGSNTALGLYCSTAGLVMNFNTSGMTQFNSGYGSVATAYGCRAWVNFNGTGTIAIRASGNVSSISDNGAGNYTVNFTTALVDANYSATATLQRENTSANYANVYGSFSSDAFSTSAFQIRSMFINDAASGYTDSPIVSVAVFR